MVLMANMKKKDSHGKNREKRRPPVLREKCDTCGEMKTEKKCRQCSD